MNGLRSGGLASVRHAGQSKGPGPSEDIGEGRSGHADLRPAQPEADTGLRQVLLGPGDCPEARFKSELARDVEHPGKFHAELREHLAATLGQCSGQSIGRDAHKQVAVRCHRDLGIANLHLLQVPPQAHDEGLDIVSTPHKLVDGDVDLDEVVEVRERVEIAQRLLGGGDAGLRVALGQFEHGGH